MTRLVLLWMAWFICSANARTWGGTPVAIVRSDATCLPTISRGGAQDEDKDDDQQQQASADNNNHFASNDEVHKDDTMASHPKETGDTAAPVGVKAHHKKGNAVGDPDGDGSDDDSDDSDLDESEWEELEEELEELMADHSTQVQVEVELVDHNDETAADNHQDDEYNDVTLGSSRPSGGGGVGLRLGQRLQNHRRKVQQNRQRQAEPVADQQQLIQAWQSHVYAPPGPAAWADLTSKARTIDGASKVRLDRRTLYCGLLFEWRHASATYRKFLEMATSQALQAALSLATQPQWRRSVAQPNAIRLYDQEPDRGCTLAMQESIAMALVSDCEKALIVARGSKKEKERTSLIRCSCLFS